MEREHCAAFKIFQHQRPQHAPVLWAVHKGGKHSPWTLHLPFVGNWISWLQRYQEDRRKQSVEWDLLALSFLPIVRLTTPTAELYMKKELKLTCPWSVWVDVKPGLKHGIIVPWPGRTHAWLSHAPPGMQLVWNAKQGPRCLTQSRNLYRGKSFSKIAKDYLYSW